jgi:tetrapyrrole methylase family protein/MazG family protein
MGFYELEAIIARLRGENGCSWDREQTHESIRRNLIEEAYETLDAIDEKDYDALCEELGDLMMQVVLHAQIAVEYGEFDLRNVCDGVCRKLIHRHPHVFGDIVADNSGVVLKNWENIKLEEKSMRTQTDAMNAVPKAMPALMRAYKIQQKAAHVGFDWEEPGPAIDKIIEEAQEIKSADEQNIAKEVGDLLFAAVNVARKYKIDPELPLYGASEKFIKRFSFIETNSPKSLSDMSLTEMDKLWEDSKKKFP